MEIYKIKVIIKGEEMEYEFSSEAKFNEAWDSIQENGQRIEN